MRAPRIGSLFSGYGGLEMGVQAVLGGSTVWVSDIDKGACKILAHRYPDVPNLGDISAVDWSQVEPVDVLTGGFPCTDISSSGAKAGIDDGEFSGLWHHMARAIGRLRPGVAIVENVRDILARGLGRVLGDLADIGYDAQWTCLPACSVGAPFRRDRLFLLATPARTNAHGFGWVAQPHRLPEARVFQAEPWDDDHRLAVGEDRLLGRWSAVLGRPAPNPVDRGVNGQPRVTPRFQEWLMGLPAGWVTDVPGITRNEALKALGNGVVPQQAEAALRALLLASEAVA